jgi:hypothetical protein
MIVRNRIEPEGRLGLMWIPNSRQWWVIWLTAAVVLGLWWSTAKEVADRWAGTDPVARQLYQQYSEQWETARGVNPYAFADYTLRQYLERQDVVRRSVYQLRALGTVVVVGVLVVWGLARRK